MIIIIVLKSNLGSTRAKLRSRVGLTIDHVNVMKKNSIIIVLKLESGVDPGSEPSQ
jgi:hypothetical protein